MFKHFVMMALGLVLVLNGCVTSNSGQPVGYSSTPVMDSATANALTLHGGVYSEQGSNQALQTAARMQSEQYRYQVDLAKAANYHQRDWNREYTRRQRDRLDHQRDLEREQTRRQENMARVATQAIDRFLDHREHNRTHPRVVQSSPRPRIRRD